MGGAMSIVLAGITSGTITLQEPAVAGTNTLNLPAATGTLALTSQLPVAGPAFSAYPAAAQTISNVTATLLQVNTKTGNSQLFDTAGAFNTTGSTTTLNGISVPAYSFAPPVAGYYLIIATCVSNGTGFVQPSIYVNNSGVNLVAMPSSSAYLGGSNQLLTYMNGTSDYVQFYFYQSSGGSITTLASRPDLYKFSGFMVRGA
jgi:hypothetical protein